MLKCHITDRQNLVSVWGRLKTNKCVLSSWLVCLYLVLMNRSSRFVVTAIIHLTLRLIISISFVKTLQSWHRSTPTIHMLITIMIASYFGSAKSSDKMNNLCGANNVHDISGESSNYGGYW